MKAKVTPKTNPSLNNATDGFVNRDILSRFVGKTCTIISSSPALIDNEVKTYVRTFLGKVLAIDEDGVLIKSIYDDCESYFFKNNINAIVEEKIKYVEEEDVEDLKEKVSLKKEEIKETAVQPDEIQAVQPNEITLNSILEQANNIKNE